MAKMWSGTGRRRFDQQTQTFRSTLAGLGELAGWPSEAGVTLVGMEATGVYWIDGVPGARGAV